MKETEWPHEYEPLKMPHVTDPKIPYDGEHVEENSTGRFRSPGEHITRSQYYRSFNAPAPHTPQSPADAGYAIFGKDPLMSHRPQPLTRRPKSLDLENAQDTVVDKQCISKCSFYILIALTFLAIAIAAGCGIIMLRFISKYNELEESLNSAKTSLAQFQQEAHLCLPCAELSQGPFEEDNVQLNSLLKKQENGVEACCAKSSEQFLTMLNLFAKRKQKERSSEEVLLKENVTAPCVPASDRGNNSNTGTPVVHPVRPNGGISAHVVASEQTALNGQHGEDDFQPIKNWLSEEPGTHLTNINMTDRGSRLVVSETGNYFLYSQVGFLFFYDTNQVVDDSKQSVFHIVYRYNAIYPLGGSQELLRSELTQCWEKQKDFGRYTSYVGASVRLNKGDQIYVKVSKIQQLSKTPQMTYFGLFKIS